MQLTPADARDMGATFTVLNPEQVSTLETIAEAIVPGAKLAGIAHYLDTQLANEPAECLLMLRYLGVPSPYSNFYLSPLNSIADIAQSNHQRDTSWLKQQQLESIIEQISSGEVANWTGPPAPFFYFVLRSDAVDLVYGTQQGFEKLGIPSMQHIKPDTWW